MVTIDNSQSLILGLVDDLGTRSTIYLYNNTKNIKEGTITITLPDETTKTITAIEDTTEISNNANYYAYTVSKNGIYTFKASDGTNETETQIIVNNIEKFKSIESLASQEGLSYAGGKQNAYTYKGAAVPKGYYVDTKSQVDTGLVVTDDIDEEGYSTGNEWVWVPINSTVGNGDYYGEESSTTELSGATDVTYIKYSKLYSFLDKTREAYGTFHPYGTSMGVLSRPSDTSNYREIAVLVGSGNQYDSANIELIKNRQTNELFTSLNNISDVAIQYRNDYESMVTSVNKYGGFYIGRYEITSNGEKNGDSLVNMNWYQFYNKCMEFGKASTESGMIYGALWDATMQWLTVAGYSVGYTGMDISGYGNYMSEAVSVRNDEITITVKAKETSQKLKTGQTSYTRRNNIYDISGNCSDWTQEAYYAGSRVYRGRKLWSQCKQLYFFS